MAAMIKNSKNSRSFSFFFLFISLLTVTITNSFASPLITPLPDVYFSDEEAFSGVGIPLGQWNLLHKSVGISAMHMQLLHDDRIVIFDRTDFGPSNLSLPAGKCITSSGVDCTAHSLLYDVASNTFRPLTVLSDTWCSSGSVDPAGKLIQTGGYALGERVIRTFTPCSRDDDLTCDWEELPVSLSSRRWYASNLLLPDGHVIIVGGRGSHNYEFFPKSAAAGKYPLQFLADTWDGRNKENNLYPFLHLLPNGHIFVFANNKSIEFDYVAGKVVRNYPIMPFRERRNYPSTGSSVLLPVSGNSSSPELEILICGGASPEAFDLAEKENVYVAASTTCGRMKITDPNPQWIMENMPMPRVMPDMVMLPTGDVLVINGAGNGTAGWENADNPVLNPVLYRTYNYDVSGGRFVVLNPTRIPRLYHSSAVLVSDGRVIVGGSNPHPNYNFTPAAKFPTELSLEAFSPPYLDQQYAVLRPSILAVETESMVVTYGQIVSVTYVLGMYKQELGVKVTILLPPFTTHSFGMNQRLVVLAEAEKVNQLSTYAYKVTVRVPINVNVAPPGFYLLFIVHAGVPSHGVWVQLKCPNS